MHEFYEMSLEKGREYIVGRYQKVEKYPAGTWLTEFLNVDWMDLKCQCEHLRKDYGAEQPLSTRFAEYYRDLHDSMVTRHPLMRNLFDEELDWCIRSCFGMAASLTAEEKTYWEDLLKDGAKPVIAERFPRTILKDFMTVFHRLGQAEEAIEEIFESVMEPEENGKNVIQRYYQFSVGNYDHMLRVNQLYSDMIPRFNFCFNGRITTGIRARHPVDQKTDYKNKELLEASGIYMVTDNLAALTFWELDLICAKNIWIRRCRHCGRWFLPTTSVNCYCNRPSPDHPDKTCKEIGAMTVYVQNMDEVKILFRLVAKRVKQAQTRAREFHPEYETYYNQWRENAKNLMEQVLAGKVSYDDFKTIIDHSGEEILRMKGELFPLQEAEK